MMWFSRMLAAQGQQKEAVLGALAEGTEILLMEDDELTPFLVLRHNAYGDANSTQLLRKYVLPTAMQFDSGGNSYYLQAELGKWLRSTYIMKFPTAVLRNVLNTQLPYTNAARTDVDTNVIIVFLLSLREVNLSTENAFAEGVSIDYFNSAETRKGRVSEGAPNVRQWLRTPNITGTRVFGISTSGNRMNNDGDNSPIAMNYVRPSFCLNSSFKVVLA